MSTTYSPIIMRFLSRAIHVTPLIYLFCGSHFLHTILAKSHQSLTPWNEVLHAVRVAAKAGHVDWEHPSGSSLQDISTVGDKGLGDRGMAVTCGSVESSVATFVFYLNTGT